MVGRSALLCFGGAAKLPYCKRWLALPFHHLTNDAGIQFGRRAIKLSLDFPHNTTTQSIFEDVASIGKVAHCREGATTEYTNSSFRAPLKALPDMLNFSKRRREGLVFLIRVVAKISMGALAPPVRGNILLAFRAIQLYYTRTCCRK